MKFEEAMTHLRAGKTVARPKYHGTVYFSIGIDEDYDHEFPCLLKHVRASKDGEKVRWRTYIVHNITTDDIFAEDWEVFEDEGGEIK
jgi:hypothetical protein